MLSPVCFVLGVLDVLDKSDDLFMLTSMLSSRYCHPCCLPDVVQDLKGVNLQQCEQLIVELRVIACLFLA